MNVIWRGASVGNALSRLKQLNTQEKNTPPEKLYNVYAHPEKTSSMQKASTALKALNRSNPLKKSKSPQKT